MLSTFRDRIFPFGRRTSRATKMAGVRRACLGHKRNFKVNALNPTVLEKRCAWNNNGLRRAPRTRIAHTEETPWLMAALIPCRDYSRTSNKNWISYPGRHATRNRNLSLSNSYTRQTHLCNQKWKRDKKKRWTIETQRMYDETFFFNKSAPCILHFFICPLFAQANFSIHSIFADRRNFRGRTVVLNQTATCDVKKRKDYSVTLTKVGRNLLIESLKLVTPKVSENRFTSYVDRVASV